MTNYILGRATPTLYYDTIILHSFLNLCLTTFYIAYNLNNC